MEDGIACERSRGDGVGQNFASELVCGEDDVITTSSDEIEVVCDGDQNSIGSQASDDIKEPKTEVATKSTSTEPDVHLGGKRYDAAIFVPALAAGSVLLYFLGNNGLRLAITAAALASTMSAGLISAVGVASRNCTQSDPKESSRTELTKRREEGSRESTPEQQGQQPRGLELGGIHPTEPTPAPAPIANQDCMRTGPSQSR